MIKNDLGHRQETEILFEPKKFSLGPKSELTAYSGPYEVLPEWKCCNHLFETYLLMVYQGYYQELKKKIESYFFEICI